MSLLNDLEWALWLKKVFQEPDEFYTVCGGDGIPTDYTSWRETFSYDQS